MGNFLELMAVVSMIITAGVLVALNIMDDRQDETENNK